MVYNRAHYPKSEKMEVLENRTEPERVCSRGQDFQHWKNYYKDKTSGKLGRKQHGRNKDM